MLSNLKNFNKEDFYKNLSTTPFCTNNFEKYGVFKKNKKEAVNYQYIQYNNDAFVSALVFDIDEPMATIKWDFVNVPKPNIMIQNKANGHAHLYYALEKPVCKTDLARIKPLNYLSVVESGLRSRLEADRSYSGLMTKNPLNEHWQTIWGENEPYSLDFLREFVTDSSIQTLRKEEYGIGRNVYLFNHLRKIAYREVLFFKNRGFFDLYERFLYNQAIFFNLEEFSNNLLSESEIRSITKSICRWTWRNFTKEKFSQIQSARAKKSRKKSMISIDGKREKSAKELAEELNVSARTVRRYQKESRNDYLNNSEKSRDEAYKLRFNNNLSWKEVAETMGKTVSAVRALANRSKLMIK